MVLSAENLAKSFEGEEVFSNFSLEVMRGDKIGIIGTNGRGKTTLMRLLAQELAPDSGNVEQGHQCLMSYFPQDHSDILSDIPPDTTVFDWLRARKQGLYDQEIRSALGKMLFGGDDAFKQVNTLSGGERARLILAGMMLSEHNLLLLDEPNNHLDLEAVSALAWGLDEYKGTAVVVSHDRDLINTVATKIIAFESDGIHTYDGTLEEYLKKKNKEPAV